MDWLLWGFRAMENPAGRVWYGLVVGIVGRQRTVLRLAIAIALCPRGPRSRGEGTGQNNISFLLLYVCMDNILSHDLNFPYTYTPAAPASPARKRL